MPTFRYKARDKFGSLFTGVLDTANRESVATQLDNLGYIPVSIEEQAPALFGPDFWKRFYPIKPEDMIVFSRQLSTLISAGLPFITAFDALVEQTTNPRLRSAIENVRRDVEQGSSFSDSLARQPRVFSRLYVSMIKAGETGGVLDEILERLATLAEHEAQTRARIKAAVRYPMFVVTALVIAFIILVTFVVPRFAALYSNFKVQLPLPTRILIGVNTVVHGYWMFLVAGVVLGIIGMRWYLGTPLGRLWWDGLKLKIPVLGPIFLKTALSRFTRIFGTLTKSGLPILQTLEIVSETVGNVVISRVVDNIRDSARQGRGIVQPMAVSKVFPSTVIQMVAIGEQTGKMEEMLNKVSEYYDSEVEYALRNLSTALEPIMLTVIGGVILFLALAIFMPWWNLINVFRGGGG
jgi:type II secretory pathway component PulF